MSTAARARAAALAVLAAVVIVVGVGSPASAHNVLISVAPADGSTVAAAPSSVVLTFDQPAQALGTEILVRGPGGSTVSIGDAVLVNSTVSQQLGAQRPAGTYTVEWRVTSADGHPVSGHFTFSATSGTGPPATPDPAAEVPTSSGAATPAAAVTRVDAGASPPSLTPWGIAAGAGAVMALGLFAVWWVRRGARQSGQ